MFFPPKNSYLLHYTAKKLLKQATKQQCYYTNQQNQESKNQELKQF